MNMACIISGPMGPEPDAMKVARPVLLNRGITHFPLIYAFTRSNYARFLSIARLDLKTRVGRAYSVKNHSWKHACYPGISLRSIMIESIFLTYDP
ncbi:MAG: hypothetical protein ACTSU9_19390, partial [Promethearchaeota archaeon]